MGDIEIRGPAYVPHIPDDVTLAQFMLDYHHPDRPEIYETVTWIIEDATGRRIGLNEVRARTQGLANALSSGWKLAEDDVVCIVSPNHVDYPIMVWACHKLGLIVTTANPTYTADELVHQLRLTRSKLMLVHPVNYEVALVAAGIVGIPESNIVLVQASPELKGAASRHATLPALIEQGAKITNAFVERKLRPGEGRTKLALLCFSSGTTGLPKAVMIPHYAVIANVLQFFAHWSNDSKPMKDRYFRPGDVVMAVLPFFHAYGLVYIIHFVLFYGMTMVVMPKFDFVSTLKSIERYRINFLPVVPPMIVLFCKHPDVKKHNLSCIRAIISGAAPLSGEVTAQLAESFPDVHIAQGYGMTELCIGAVMARVDKRVATPGSSGIMMPGTVARVVKTDGTLARRGEPGELVVTSPSLALGYLRNEEATKSTFKNGWVHTGDEVIINEEGEVFVIDRIKELLKVKGFQVAPAELEGFLLDHPDVADVCVVGVEDDYSGDLPLAFIVPSARAQELMKQNAKNADSIKAAIIKYVADGKTHYKQLTAGVEFVDAIPKNPSGKLLRRFLRDRAREMWKNGELSVKPRAKL